MRYISKAFSALKHESSERIIDGKDLVYDGNPKQKEERLSYLDEVGFSDVSYITVNDLPGVSIGMRLFFMFLYFPLFLWLGIFAVVSKNRASIALSILTLTQNFLLLNVVRKHSVKKVVYFYPFENDANFNANVLMSEGINVLKVPGPNPLPRFHTYMVSTQVALCAGFQLEQYDQLKQNWYIDEVVSWPLYGFQDFKKYLNDNQSQYSFDLGFISSGVWKRRQLGLQSLESDYESEEELIEWIKDYAKRNGINKLFIYLHPIESKTMELFKEAKSYYKSIFFELELGFPEFGERSYENFYKANLALSSHSTTNLQRLFCGYKVFYTPMKYKVPLFPNTSIDEICILNKEDFLVEVQGSLRMTDSEFFQRYNLKEYHYSATLQ